MAQSGLPVSSIIRSKEQGGELKKASRDDYRKAKELEEARKAGTVPAEQDEEGRDINPHIPHYIASSPWYLGSVGPTLKHQRMPDEKKKIAVPVTEWYKKGVTNHTASKFRKGACENCGAMTHQKKDCLERPRKVGARFTGTDIAPDEYVNADIGHDFEGKRDRWNGYDPNEYKAVVEEYSKLEQVKRLLKADKLQLADASEFGEKPPEEVGEVEAKVDTDVPMDDEDKYADDMEMPGTKVDSKQRITVRNLRIREDTAKYLLNLDPNSAYYDPKTRSMRENPLQDQPVKASNVMFAGENVIRYSGETNQVAQSQLFAWDASEKGVNLNLQSDPTKAELLGKQYEEKRSEFKKSIERSVLDKYGGAEHLEAPPKEMLLAQTETFVQYSRRGEVIKGMDKLIVRSRYEEDVYINNHTSVWGSYWENGNWGYKCCHSFVKMSYCTGMAGIMAKKGKEPADTPVVPPVIPSVPVQEERKRKRSGSASSSSSSSSSGSSSESSSSSSSDSEDEEESRKRKVKAAMKAQADEEKEAEKLLAMDERQRPYNSMYNVKKLTDEEVEAYRMREIRSDDPMANFVKKK